MRSIFVYHEAYKVRNIIGDRKSSVVRSWQSRHLQHISNGVRCSEEICTGRIVLSQGGRSDQARLDHTNARNEAHLAICVVDHVLQLPNLSPFPHVVLAKCPIPTSKSKSQTNSGVIALRTRAYPAEINKFGFDGCVATRFISAYPMT